LSALTEELGGAVVEKSETLYLRTLIKKLDRGTLCLRPQVEMLKKRALTEEWNEICNPEVFHVFYALDRIKECTTHIGIELKQGDEKRERLRILSEPRVQEQPTSSTEPFKDIFEQETFTDPKGSTT
jgi:hypothetical protein